MDVEGAAPGAKGTDWTAEQAAIVVANYFQMLGRERAGDKVNKAGFYRRLATELGRSEKSIEWKLRNVSAVLEELGIAWIPGLLPAHNYQDSLVEAVEAQLGLHPKVLIDPVSVRPQFTSAGGPVLVPPPAFLNSDPQDRQPALRRLVGKYDPAARDELNRFLGHAGEEMVFRFEFDRLCQAGRRDLAKAMDWPADRGEDHMGYDVRSFESDGEERLLEIKTTNGHARTPFWLSRTQYEVAARSPSTYRVRRVFHFQNGAEMFDIKPPLDAGLRLIPEKYVAVPR
ncbi:DUF3883 domain-containing protein [Bradyrhizobium sp. WSM1253]|uniref:DUF3883 domain-containing protein n=1 Tax=Bradyrhizobium sp. WSM1253 TaxID=319003 RepID=UPI00025D2E1B|nr:DUF3883 domain-containing protein [Bradyrhizobium sp. WSM1253]EIG62884.1 hypothetical protein Bra1253DRAFT_07828 [Bradyrhizobium sp. WSM1253]